MQHKKNRFSVSFSSMFLMELIFAILIFSIASAISVSAFAKAHALSSQASVENASVSLVSSAADLGRSSSSYDDAENVLAESYSKADFANGICSVYYDRNLAECSAGQAAYILSVQLLGPKGGLLTAELDFQKADPEDGQDSSLYHLEIEHAVRQ